jgi:hypothetical protein
MRPIMPASAPLVIFKALIAEIETTLAPSTACASFLLKHAEAINAFLAHALASHRVEPSTAQAGEYAGERERHLLFQIKA